MSEARVVIRHKTIKRFFFLLEQPPRLAAKPSMYSSSTAAADPVQHLISTDTGSVDDLDHHLPEV